MPRTIATILADAVMGVALATTSAALLLQFAYAFLAPGGGPFGWAAWVEDDFFYYVVIARHIVQTGVSTFDGVTLTNGYHPLWMLAVVAIGAVFDTRSEGFFLAVFAAQAALVLGGVVAFATLARRAVATGFFSSGGAMAASAAYGLLGAVIAAQGMEIALLWPLMPLLLSRLWRLCDAPSLARAFAALLLLSATILSRLDAAVVFAPVCVAVLVLVIARRGLRPTLRLWPAALGLAPLVAYVLLNLAVFGGVTPISGEAKRLTVDGAGPGLSLAALKSFTETANATYWLSPIGSTLFSGLGLLAVVVTSRRRTFAGAGLLLAGVGAVAFYVQAAWGSEWRLWRWYFYPVALVGAAGFGVAVDIVTGMLRNGPAALRPAARWLGAAAAAIFMLAVLKANAYLLFNPPGRGNMLFTRAIPIAEFARAHPGRYAMGDGAGAVGFLLDQPLTQLEGLVNDRAMLADIRARGRLRDSLARQQVDYYIGSPRPETAGCVTVHEPNHGGARTARLTDTICRPPVFTSVSGWVSSAIWDVRAGFD